MYKGGGQPQMRSPFPLQPRNSWTTRRKSTIHDDYGVLETMAWMWRLLGIFPFTVTESEDVKKYEINKFYVFHGFAIFLVCLAFMTDEFWHYSDYMRTQDMARIFTSLMTGSIASLMCMLISNVVRIYRYKKLRELIEAMVAQGTFLEKMNCRLNYEIIARSLRMYLWISAAIGLMLLYFDFYAVSRIFKSVVLRWLFWIIPSITQVLDLTIFVTLVGLLGSKFHALNKKITSIAIRANASSPKVIVTSDVCAERLRLVTKAHYNLCTVGKRINRFFDWDVIITVVTDFIILSATLHAIFLEVQRPNKTNYIRIGWYVYWQFIHSIPILVVVVICNWTSRQADHAGRLIHEIRVDSTDSKLYESLKTFSLQLHHQKLEFTAGGFFPLNSTLLQGMVADITTYLVILIQFEPRVTWEEDTPWTKLE